MQILPDWNLPILIDSLTAPIPMKYHWVFNAPLVDFTLSKIEYLEETDGPAIKIRVNGAEFWVPESWYIMVSDRDTFQLDTVEMRACATNKHSALIFCPDENSIRMMDIAVIDYSKRMKLVHPLISKGNALVHPVGPALKLYKDQVRQLSVIIGPHDLYKHIADCTAGDVFTY